MMLFESMFFRISRCSHWGMSPPRSLLDLASDANLASESNGAVEM